MELRLWRQGAPLVALTLVGCAGFEAPAPPSADAQHESRAVRPSCAQDEACRLVYQELSEKLQPGLKAQR